MNKKKLLALLMALVMTLTLVPVTALADETVMSTQDYETAVANVSEGGTVTLAGNVTYGADHSVAVWEKGFNLDLGGHTFTTNSEVNWNASNGGYTTAAICFGDNTGDYVNASVRNGTIHTSYGAGIYADGAVTVTLSSLTVAQDWANYVQSTPEYSSAIRLTSKAKVIVESGTYTGKNAIAVSNSGGEITINDGTFTGDIFFSNSFSSGLTAADKKITINGGTFNGAFVNADKGTLVIKGGTFNSDPTPYVPDSGYNVTQNGNTWTVSAKTYVAQIGDEEFETLAAAITAANASDANNVTITLLANCDTGTATMKNPLALTKPGAVLNLNGKTITVPGNFSFVIQGNNIEVKDGSIISGTNTAKTTKINSYILVVNDCDGVKLTNLTMMGGVSIGGSQDDWGTVTNPTIDGVHGANKATNVIITDCDITSGDYYALCSQMNSTATINGGKYTANTANGCTASRVLHGYFTGTDGPQGSIFVTDGQFSGKIENNNAGWIVISGGIFSDSPETGLLKDGYEVVDNTNAETKNDYPHKVVATSVARIGETKYATLAEAFEHAQDNDKIILLTDTSVDSTITVGSITVELDLNGHVVTNNAGASCRAFELSDYTNFTVTGTTAGSGMVNSAAVDGQTYGFFRIYNRKNATLTVNGGTYTGNTNNGAFVRVSKSSSGTVVNLTNVNVTTDWAIFDNTNGGAVTLTMTGGTYTQNNVVDGVGKLDSENKPVGAIHVTSRSNLVMDGVTLTSMGGTGVAVETQSTATLENCTISITGTENKWASCAVGIGGLSTVTLDGGTYTSGLHGVSYYTSGGELIVDGDATITGAADGIAYFYDTGYYSNLWKDYFPDGVPFYTTLIDGTINKGLVSYNNGVTNAAKNDSVLVVEGGKINGDYTVGGTVDTYDITGGKFTADPSDYVADGYEAVSISESPYTHQVGIVKATATTNGTIATSASIDFTVGTAVKESDAATAATLAEKNNLTVTVSGTTVETTAADAPSVAVATLSNIKDDATLKAIVENAVEEVSSNITGNNDNVNVVIQVAKSAPTTEEGKVTYYVHPEAVISVNNVKVGTVDLANEQIKGTFTFKLNVSSIAQAGDYVRIDHMENDAVLDSKTYKVGEDSCVEITGIERFSTFVGEKVNTETDDFKYLGASLRRRVQINHDNIVVNSCTDMRFGFVVKGYNSNSNEDYYFRWKKGDGTWSSPVKIDKFANTTDGWVASLVITNIPADYFNTTITARIYKNVEQNALEGDGMSVIDVANAIITKYEDNDDEKQWVDYAKYLKATSGSYTVTYGDDHRVNGYNYTAQ